MLTVLEREICRQSLYEFVQLAWPQIESAKYIDSPHIKAVCDHLQAVYEDKIDNLLINIPPGCSKSLISGVFFPAWVWSIDSTKRFFHACYDSRLSIRDSVKCRVLLETRWYQELFPGQVVITKDQNQKSYYENTAGGWRMATSVGGHGTGEHPHFIIVDDPNNVKQAESAAERQSCSDWWTMTMPTRGISLKSKRVVIQQRLHEQDLTGVCLEMGGYDHLCLPMRYEGPRPATSIGFTDWRTDVGELLAPDQFSESVTAKLEKALGPYGVAGQLQQRPVPRSGGMFNVDRFEIVSAAPVLLNECRYWDTAASDGKGDYTAGVRMGKARDGYYYVSGVERGQWASNDRKARQRMTAEVDGINVTQIQAEEPGSAGKDQSSDFARLMAGFSVQTDRQTGSKVVRADPYSSQVNAGNVRLVRGDWNRDFIEEHKVAPKGQHDDQWDAAAGAFSWLENRCGLMEPIAEDHADPGDYSMIEAMPRGVFSSHRPYEDDD